MELLSYVASGTPAVTTQPTAATLFRSQRPVLLLDEVDNLRNKDKETYGEVLQVLNQSFKKGGTVERTEKTKDGWTVKEYLVYRAVALAGLEGLADSLRDRCFMIRMKRAKQRKPRLTGRIVHDDATRIRNDIDKWLKKNEGELQKMYRALPDETKQLRGLDDRLQDISEPLLILSLSADTERDQRPEITNRLIKALMAVSGRREPSVREEQLLVIIEEFRVRMKEDDELFMATQTLLDLCSQRDELARIDTGRKLAFFLKAFDLFPGKNKEGVLRGYTVTRAWLDEWSDRYDDRGTDGSI